MAKKNKEVAGEGNESGGSKLVTVLIALVIILIWLAVFAFLIKLDVGGIGSNILYPVLRDVPVINKILPEPSEEVQAGEDNYQYTTLKSANARIKELESLLASEGDATSANSGYIKELEAEVRNLQRYKDAQDAFKKQVEDFNEDIVFNDKAPDISEYRKYYESIEPENADRIYRQVIKAMQYTEKAQELATFYSNMDAQKAAAAITEMKEDLPLICDILENMSEKQAAAILQELDSEFAAQITKKISAVNE